MTESKLHKGKVQLKNWQGFPPIEILFEDIGQNVIQLDVKASGLLNYFGQVDRNLEIDIHTNILNSLKEYSNITEHDCSEIGYSIIFKPSKKLNRKTNLFELEIELTVIFKKPVEGAYAHTLQPTMQLITATILAEIFLQND